jgi:hypothetical protein
LSVASTFYSIFSSIFSSRLSVGRLAEASA